MQTRINLFIPLLCIALTAIAANADSISIASSDPTGKPTVYDGVKIVTLDNSKIVFSTSAGNQVTKDVTSVVDLSVEDEPAFNNAQQDFAANRLEKAVDEYDQVISKTDKPWLKTYCMPRFTESASKTGRFDKAVSGYIDLVLHDPANASKIRPNIPQFGNPGLDGAARALEIAADAAGIQPQQQTALLSLLLDVQRARRDNNAMTAVAQRLSGNPSKTGDPISDLASAALADAKLAEARNAIAQKQFDQVISSIENAKPLFTDAPRQAEALFLIAQAREGQAEAADLAKQDASGRDAMLRDAAIAYFRVVADFKNATGAPRAADSLLAAAAILEKLKQPGKAIEAYQSIITDFPNTPQADQAKRQVDRLQSAAKKIN
jgi:tetratricopeptide (TPR) repeat protein